MLYNNNYMYGYMNKCNCTKSYFRVLNAVKNSPALDVYVNEILLASNLKYSDFSRYMKFMPGNYKMKIYVSGSQKEPIFETEIEIGKNLAYTSVISGDFNDISNICVYLISDGKEGLDMNRMSSVVIANLIPNSENLEIVTSDGTVLASNLNYGEVTNSLALPSGMYDILVKKNDNVILEAPNIDFAPKMYYTLFLIGEYGEKPKIELIIPQDGLNYLDLC